MKHRNIAFTFTIVLVYTAAAAVLAGWLAVRASNGGLFKGASASYRVIVPTAPAVEASKTEIVSQSGVRVGVVTGVAVHPKGVLLDLKITGHVVVGTDASAEVVIKNVVGEKSVMLHAGSGKTPEAKNGALLRYGGAGKALEPDEALDPVKRAIGTSQDKNLKDFFAEQKTVLSSAAQDAEAILVSIQELTAVLSEQDAALSNLSRRTSELVNSLSAHGEDIQSLAAEAAALSGEIRRLLDQELDTLDRGFGLAADTLMLLAGRQKEMNTILARLPKLAKRTQEATDLLVRLLHNEGDTWVDVGVRNLPDLEETLAILKEMD